MNKAALILACGLSVGCIGETPAAPVGAASSSPERGATSPTSASGAPASQPVANAPAEEEPIVVKCTGTVLTARESPQNKRFPARGGHWILEVEVEAWSAADGSAQPTEALRLIVPRPVIEGVVPRPRAGERVEVEATLVAGKPGIAEAQSLVRTGG